MTTIPSQLKIATGAILKTKQFPHTNEGHEHLPGAQKVWDQWKIYKPKQEDAWVNQVVESNGFAGAALPPPAPLRGGDASNNNSGATWDSVDAAPTKLAYDVKA